MTWTETAIADALDGKFYRPPNTERAYTNDRRSVSTGDQELIIAMYRDGKTHRQMAAELGLSAGTVGRYILHLFDTSALQRRGRA